MLSLFRNFSVYRNEAARKAQETRNRSVYSGKFSNTMLDVTVLDYVRGTSWRERTTARVRACVRAYVRACVRDIEGIRKEDIST